MAKQNVIDDFHGSNFFLDNFFPAKTEYDGETYDTTEHAFQAAKATNFADKFKIMTANSPAMAKMLGRTLSLRGDWEYVKRRIMRDIVRAKFRQHPALAKKLVETGDAQLIEGNTWNDKVWGVCNGEGKNWLGKILMELREELKKEA